MTVNEVIVELHYKVKELEEENKKLKKEINRLNNIEINGLYEDIRMLNVKHDELKSEYEDSEYDRDSLYWDYWELKEKCDKVFDVANSFLINEADIEELLFFIKQLTA